MQKNLSCGPLLPIARPSLPALTAIAEALNAALESRIVTNGGPYVNELERRLSDLLEVPSLAFCNGEQALITLLMAAGVEGGEVILPSFTFAGTAHAVMIAGAQPVFADVQSLEIPLLDPEDVERRITERTVAILAVDAYGFACDYERLAAIAKRHGLRFFIDSAPAFGTRIKGRLSGAHGDGQIFSFHATKPYNTIEGGCLCSHDELLLKRATAIRNFGQDGNGNVPWVGLNGKMSELNAIIGLEQLAGLDNHLQQRRRAALYLLRGLQGIPGLHACQPQDGQEPVWQYLPVRVDAIAFGLDRDTLQTQLHENGIAARRYYSPACHQMGAYANLPSHGLERTERLSAEMLALPVYNDMTEAECERILSNLQALHLRHSAVDRKGAMQ